MTQPGEVERPAGGAGGVSVAWRSAAVRGVAGPAADRLAIDGVPAALAAKDPSLWGPEAAAEAAIRLGWLDAPRASRALLGSLAGNGPLPAGEPALTDGAVEVHAEPGLLPGHGGLAGVLDSLLLAIPDRGYLAIMAYLDRDGDAAAAALRDALASRTTHPVTFGWGPRFLHSTGQYHKGGPGNGAFLQITGAVRDDVQVPGRDFTLGRLQLAQALGDIGALHQRGRPAVRLHLRDRAAGVAQVLDAARAGTTGSGR